MALRGGFCRFHVLPSLIMAISLTQACDLYPGRWVFDSSMYFSKTCPFVEKEFNCQRNGRPDQDYLKYRWQPDRCDLPRFDGIEFMKKYQGKKIMFVGDSLTRDQWSSFTCLLYNAAPKLKYNLTRVGLISTFTILDYGIEVWLDRNAFLVDIVNQSQGRILKLDSIEGGKNWIGFDMLLFNTYHWWNYRHAHQPWDFIQIGDKILKDMDRNVAFETALGTWGKWVDTNVDPAKTKVYYLGISPNHYNGSDWGEPRKKNCVGQIAPVRGSTYPGLYPVAMDIVRMALSKIKNPVTLLDITFLSLLRKDGHPSIYGVGGASGMDCTHWCVSGVPDTWNQILYSLDFAT